MAPFLNEASGLVIKITSLVFPLQKRFIFSSSNRNNPIHMVKHKPLLLSVGFLLFGSVYMFAQQNTDAAGGNATGSGGSVSYSVGQIDYNYQTGSNGNLNQGLQQPYEIFISGVDDPAIQLGLSVYPNPSTNVLYLKIEKD